MKGGRLLGKGTYGCVFDKTFDCIDGEKYTTGVSKVFADSQSATEEYEEVLDVTRVDKLGKFTNPALAMCTIEGRQLKRDKDYKKCNIITEVSGDYEQIVYKHTGMDMARYALRSTFDKTMLEGFLNVLIGIQELQKLKKIHRDIKPPNMLITDKKQMLLIDFGLMTSYKKLYDADELPITGAHYYVYPPEFKLYHFISRRFEEANHVAVEKTYAANLRALKTQVARFAQNQSRAYWKQGYEIPLFDKCLRALKLDMPAITSQFDSFCEKMEKKLDLENLTVYGATAKMTRSNRFIKRKQIKAEFDTLCDKMDVFSIGVSMAQIYAFSKTSKFPKVYANKFKAIVAGAMSFNPYERSDIQTLVREMDALLKSMRSPTQVTDTKAFIKNMIEVSGVAVEHPPSPARVAPKLVKSKTNKAFNNKKRDASTTPSVYHSANLTFDDKKNNCLEKYTLVELKAFIRNKPEFKGMSGLKKADLCSKVASVLMTRGDSHKPVKRGRPTK